jgi:hypothetical protein
MAAYVWLQNLPFLRCVIQVYSYLYKAELKNYLGWLRLSSIVGPEGQKISRKLLYFIAKAFSHAWAVHKNRRIESKQMRFFLTYIVVWMKHGFKLKACFSFHFNSLDYLGYLLTDYTIKRSAVTKAHYHDKMHVYRCSGSHNIRLRNSFWTTEFYAMHI